MRPRGTKKVRVFLFQTDGRVRVGDAWSVL